MSVSALEQSSQERYHGIDLVRSVAMLLGIVIHVSVFFMDDAFPFVLGERYTDPVNRLIVEFIHLFRICLLYTSPSPRDGLLSRMPSSA